MEGLLGEILNEAGIKDGIKQITECAGGDISSAYKVKTEAETYFIKLNEASFIDNFQAEFAGLHQIKQTSTILVPDPIKAGIIKQRSYIIMTCLPNLRSGSADLGEPLARMHNTGQGEKFGFPILTFCGSTKLDNTMTNEPWSEWFAKHRISYMLELIGSSKITRRTIQEVELRIIELLKPHDKDVVPTLVHGDLWSGNCGTSNGTPCIYDPACYYGDGEVDLAMTELFGSLGRRFYEKYESIRKIHDGYHQRKKIYNLYHILNHAYMFGGFYETEASTMIEDLFQ